MVSVVNVLNALWFGAAFGYFALTPGRAAKLLAPRSQRATPLYRTLVASLRFLGGMNLALAALALALALPAGAPAGARPGALCAAVFALAHASQFACNVPILLGGGRRGDALWPVRRGPMAFIFAVDGALALANALAAAWLVRVS
jgi:hypothetical protein